MTLHEPIYPPSLVQREREQAARPSYVAAAQAGAPISRVEFAALSKIAVNRAFIEPRGQEGVVMALKIRGLAIDIPNMCSNFPALSVTAAGHALLDEDDARQCAMNAVDRCLTDVRLQKRGAIDHSPYDRALALIEEAKRVLVDAAPVRASAEAAE